MIHALLALDIDTPATPPAYQGDPNLVTPGVVGFIITFGIALVTVLLVIDMVRRIRRVRYRAAVQDGIAAEVDAAGNAAVDDASGSEKPAS